MAELTNLETKLGEVIGLAMAAQAATEEGDEAGQGDATASLVERCSACARRRPRPSSDGTRQVAASFERQEDGDPRRGAHGQDQGRRR